MDTLYHIVLVLDWKTHTFVLTILTLWRVINAIIMSYNHLQTASKITYTPSSLFPQLHTVYNSTAI